MLHYDIIKETLRTVFDPEIPVNVFDMGLIYNVEISPENDVIITMTLSAPNCPMADQIFDEVKEKVSYIEGVKSVKVNLVFDPPWSKDMMSEAALLDLGLL